MDAHEGPARLEWWGNSSTSLGGFDVRVTVRAVDGDWTCDAILDGPPPEEHREVFDALMGADPVFTLRFDGDAGILVDVASVGNGDRLVLTAHEQAARAR
ncbi:hypothetical protein [Streptomyces albireticuli]|uniref:Uncharacterized protein n=1 Tax=Streptomyces albireticuli TaxID=1940 RepID=A0A2A2DEX3_9ACTN|nr:hypothetical protein [Streptomyces albireticuli]MCD9194771.1 hypothetical protein [Streptomyces albireticuli]PAU49997.1 hypothetical protein CK936_04925 [Streptomyces albireticuli]